MFSLDGYLCRFGNLIFNSLYIGVLWLIGCLPIVTIGTSTTAIYYTCMKLSTDENQSILKLYWKSYKVNLKQSIIVYLPMLMIAMSSLYFYTNRIYFNRLGNEVTTLFVILSLIFSLISLNVFPLLAKFNLTTVGVYKMAVAFCYVNPLTIIKNVLTFILVVVISFVFPVYLILMIGLFFLLTARNFHHDFQKVITKNSTNGTVS